MACNEYIDLIFKKIDKEITTEEEAELNAHFEMCSECRDEYHELCALEDTLLRLPEEDVPQSFAAEVTERIAAQSLKPKKIRFKPYFSLAAACVVLVVVLFYNVIDGTLYKRDAIIENPRSAVSENATEGASDMGENMYDRATDETVNGSEDINEYEFDEAAAKPQEKPHLFNAADTGNSSSGDSSSGSSSSGSKASAEEYAAESYDAADAVMQESSEAETFDDAQDFTDIPDESVPLVAAIQSAPQDDMLKNSEYATVASVTITQSSLEGSLDGLSYTLKEDDVYEMSEEDFEIFKERMDELGVTVSEESHNPESNIVMIIVSIQ